MVDATSISGEVMRLTSTFRPWRARCWPRSAPGTSSLLAGLAGDDARSPPAWPFSGTASQSATARVAARLPSQHDHDAVELQAGLLDVGHEDHRPAGFEQHAFVDHFLRRRSCRARPGRRSTRSKRRARRPSCSAAPAMLALTHAAFRTRRRRAWRPARSGRSRRCARLLGFGALRLDEFRRNAAHDRAGDDRLVDERDAEHVRLESLGHRDRVIAGGIAARRGPD